MGLNFCPTPQVNITELKRDLKEFERKLRLKEMFHDSPNSDDSLVKNASIFCPEKGSNKELDLYCEKIDQLELEENRNVKNNLSKKQIKALTDLKNNKNLVIKEADKGSAVVIMDKTYYIQKIQEMLDDQNYYKPIESNKDNHIIATIKKLCKKYENNLTKNEKKYLTEFDHKTSNFYGLPKIHKSTLIKEAINTQKSEYIEIKSPTDLKFRPIVAGTSSPTQHLSNLIDILLQKFITKMESYVRDDIDFLNHIPSQVEPHTTLSTFDITSLYSNIPNELGTEAIYYWLNQYPELLHPRFDPEFVLEGIKIILENNTFNFNSQNYIQILGTAMGSIFAPSYATLTLGFLEIKLHQKIESIYGNQIKAEFIELWKRYLDDCFIFWKQSWGDIKDLHEILQTLHPQIKFTLDSSQEKIPFLDILISINHNGTITTDIYRKITDTQQYLHFKSHHPKSCLTSIPYSLARRICTIVVDSNLRVLRLQELEVALGDRGYPISVIKKGIELAIKIPISELRSPKKDNKEDTIAFVSTFNKRNPELFTHLKQYTHILKRNEKMKNILDSTKLIKSKRQNKNLKKLLTSSRVEETLSLGSFKCNKNRCNLCNIIIEGSSYLFKHSNEHFFIRSKLNCQSRNVIYILECDSCSECYLGATNCMNERLYNHRRDINNEEYRTFNVSRHIHQCGTNFRFMPIYSNPNYNSLLLYEQIFIRKFKPSLNRNS